MGACSPWHTGEVTKRATRHVSAEVPQADREPSAGGSVLPGKGWAQRPPFLGDQVTHGKGAREAGAGGSLQQPRSVPRWRRVISGLGRVEPSPLSSASSSSVTSLHPCAPFPVSTHSLLTEPGDEPRRQTERQTDRGRGSTAGPHSSSERGWVRDARPCCSGRWVRRGVGGDAAPPSARCPPLPVSHCTPPAPIPQVSVVPVPGRSRQGALWLCLEKRLHRATGPGAAAPWGVGG